MTPDEMAELERLKREICSTINQLRDDFIAVADSFGPTILQYETALKKIKNHENCPASLASIADRALKRIRTV